jgi:hypothetical protein
MTEKPQPCDLCQAQVKAGRRAKPHANLERTRIGTPYSHGMVGGGGVDSLYVCKGCGTTLFHSTDKHDFGWQFN